MNQSHSLSRRDFLGRSTKATALGLLASGLPAGWTGSAHAADAPNVNFGIIALTDCSPIVIAHEKGLFKKYGINSTVTKGASWAAIRDSLANGDIQATHMLIGMPIASTMGLGGAPKADGHPLAAQPQRPGHQPRQAAQRQGRRRPERPSSPRRKAKAAGNPITFAMTFPPGTHAMWMRYWLAAGGINPGDAKAAGPTSPSSPSRRRRWSPT
jgi:nitrate/nitrite transport system substrate-binding protein